ncbi:MAG TPA: CoA-transferase [Acidimicrobiia bacterium]|nr:CoA-transferase [Acidimicrobiia bacterium]
MSDVTIADVCVVACAEAWRGDGEILASPIGVIPTLGSRLAALTFEPDLVYSDGDAVQLGEPLPAGAGPDAARVAEAWLPFGKMFDIVWSGRRHVMMGATQVDRFGNQNIACIGPWEKPKAQLLGVRGAPGNTVNNPTSYFVPQHGPRVFVESVDCVSGVGYDRAAAAGSMATEHHEIRRVISNLGVFDFETPDHAMRLRSVHPGVSVDAVVEATGFALVVPDDVPETRAPTDEDLRLLRDVLDPDGLRVAEVPAP